MFPGNVGVGDNYQERCCNDNDFRQRKLTYNQRSIWNLEEGIIGFLAALDLKVRLVKCGEIYRRYYLQ